MLVLDACACYKKQGGTFTLLMVGEGNARSQLEQHAQELNLSDDVVFAGAEKNRAKLCAIYLTADLFMFPSVYDNAPLVVREAAMARCPSIMISGSNAAENSRDGYDAYLCQNDLASLTDTLSRALSDPHRRQVGENAQQTIAQPWSSVAKSVRQSYDQILTDWEKTDHPFLLSKFSLKNN